MIYETEGCFVISSQQVWMPGAYKTRRAANYAFRFSDKHLVALRNRINHTGGLITFEDLQELRKELNKQ